MPLDFSPARSDLACFSFVMDAWKIYELMGRRPTPTVAGTMILLTFEDRCHGHLTGPRGLSLDEAIEYAIVCRGEWWRALLRDIERRLTWLWDTNGEQAP